MCVCTEDNHQLLGGLHCVTGQLLCCDDAWYQVLAQTGWLYIIQCILSNGWQC